MMEEQDEVLERDEVLGRGEVLERGDLVRREMVARTIDQRVSELLGNVPLDSERWRVWSVWRLREQGFSVDEKAGYLGVGIDVVRKSLQLARVQLGRGIVDLEEERSLDLSRVDRLLQVYMQHAEAGDLQSASLVYRLLSYREKLLGLGRVMEVDVNKDFWKRVSSIIDVTAGSGNAKVGLGEGFGDAGSEESGSEESGSEGEDSAGWEVE